MHRTRSHGRGRLVAAMLVSLSLHGLIGLGWLNARNNAPAEGPGIDVTVEGPEDRDFGFVLREPRPDPMPDVDPQTIKPQHMRPAPLPRTVIDPPSTAHAGAVQPIGASPDPPSDLPKFGGARPLHGRARPGTTVVYLLDRSASMGPNGLLTRAANAVRASLAELGPDVRFQIVAYNGAATPFWPEPLAAGPQARERASEWLANLTAEGRSKHVSGFREAMAARPSDVFLLTDADDLDDAEVRAIGPLLRTPARLTAAVFGGNRPARATPLERLAERTGGAVTYVGP